MDTKQTSLIRLMRRSLGLSAVEFGKMAGRTSTVADRAERREANGQLKLVELARMADLLGCEVEYVLRLKRPGANRQQQFRRHLDLEVLLEHPPKPSAGAKSLRLRARLRDSEAFQNDISRFEPKGCFVQLFGHEFQVSPSVYFILAELALAYPQAVSEKRLIETFLGDDLSDARLSLNVFLTGIRKKLQGPWGKIGIKSVGHGLYTLEPPSG